MSAMQPEQRNIPLASKYTAGFCGSGAIVSQVPSKGLWLNDAGEKSNRAMSVFIKAPHELRRNTSYRQHGEAKGTGDVNRPLRCALKAAGPQREKRPARPETGSLHPVSIGAAA